MDRFFEGVWFLRFPEMSKNFRATLVCDKIASKSGPGGTLLTHFDSFLMFSGVSRSRRFLGFPENPIFHHFDHFGTFQTGHPENPKIHHFDHFWTFQIGHPENPIFHNFDHFSRFPDFTECNCPGHCNPSHRGVLPEIYGQPLDQIG